MAAHTDNTIVIEAPFDLVWDWTNDVEDWPNLFTEYASAEVLERKDNTIRFRLTMHPLPNGEVWTWISERTMDKANRTVTARRIELGWFEYMRLHWTYEEVPGGVKMRWQQDFQMRSDAPWGDEAVAEKINSSSKVQMAHIKQRLEQRYAALAVS
ncbi:aromatase [Streptoalloteichus tenebrarius]|uniref:Aromatase n=1 Tax=Streptoalloteichus tenebrarius (strain ATCC 17920 / DSM 40477 / JCM 4838 / CBS 697.72 / NBRC 16177 / NCIMB 11028 / NRRL B-12390 / A12253. 1 / ISP 5477) TaxID=1933 RepID=A0ABT1HX12_STRSD|nr:SRPBCC family protein [Streptoalloteichus tenebrarius]MCP2260055.1 aromatase [Streptoalloteichus tenebrarius]BFF03823.1 SRPBCC family protein [Streptoalloteichus tenebrarius]